ncbi:Flagellar motor protein MotB [Flavobacterium sp. 9AF]|uniref:OmpA family protein n=1 Tax=Flavobacterium sp. 9AF TaxID=2653142 RepID=UPI0012F46230|nr:OmpA family protein [Flavobacterium sp. 9AF]VXC26480.1 Flagellar motor protein MotB [Flavobacterium sp. 9AF]
MSKKLLYFLGILLTILIGTWLFTKFCCPCCEAVTVPNERKTNEKITTVDETTRSSHLGFSVSDLKITKNESLNFLNSNFSLLLPVSDSIDKGINQLREELKKRDSNLKLTGLYSSKEKNNSIFPNLGLARANAVKNYLITKGFSEKQIEIADQVEEALVVKNDTVFGPIILKWLSKSNVDEGAKDWEVVKANLNANPLTLYFNTGQSAIVLTQEQKEKLAMIMDYINHVEGSKINVTGHSDNTPGVRHSNQYYSLERARFAKDYFVLNGILENKIEISGKGEMQPIADNTTESGRAKNRRTEITIK